jgi:ribosome-associated protein
VLRRIESAKGRCYNPAGQHRSRRSARLDSQAIARRIVDVASDKQAIDVVMLDLQEVSLVADYFVICSGTSERQLKAISDDIVDTVAREEKVKPRRREGVANSGWILLDYGPVVVHIFSPEMRDFYRLEKMWSTAVPVLHIV